MSNWPERDLQSIGSTKLNHIASDAKTKVLVKIEERNSAGATLIHKHVRRSRTGCITIK